MNVCVFGAGAVGGYLAAHLTSREVAEVSTSRVAIIWPPSSPNLF